MARFRWTPRKEWGERFYLSAEEKVLGVNSKFPSTTLNSNFLSIHLLTFGEEDCIAVAR
jgi:hypothetical protein